MDYFCNLIKKVIRFVCQNKILVLSFVMSLTSFVLFCHLSVRFSTYTIDMQSAVTWATSILIFLVSLLIGWNIYNAIGIMKDVSSFKKETTGEIDRIENRISSMAKNTENAFDHIQQKIKGSLEVHETYIDGCIAFCQGLIQDDDHLMRKYSLYASAIWHFGQCNNENAVQDYIDNCLANMQVVINKLKNGGKMEENLDINQSFCIAKGAICSCQLDIDQKQKELFLDLEKERMNIKAPKYK